MPDFGFDDVMSSSLAEFTSFFSFFFQLFFPTFCFCMMYVTQTPQTTDSKRAVQRACYNQLPTTLCTPVACQQSRNQHHTRAVVCPRSICLWIPSCFCYRTLRSVGLRISAAVWYMHAATSTITQIFHNIVIWHNMRMIKYRMLYVFQFVLAPIP